MLKKLKVEQCSVIDTTRKRKRDNNLGSIPELKIRNVGNIVTEDKLVDKDTNEKEYQVQNVLIPNVLITSGTMEAAVNYLCTQTPRNCYIAMPYITTWIEKSSPEWQKILDVCAGNKKRTKKDDIYMFPTFVGPINFGHWFLTILKITGDNYKGYVIDSLESSWNTRYLHVKSIFQKICKEGIEWKHFKSVEQHELECGPRTICQIFSIVINLNNNQQLDVILSNLKSETMRGKSMSEFANVIKKTIMCYKISSFYI